LLWTAFTTWPLMGCAQTSINSHLFVTIFGTGIPFWAARCRYYQIAMILKWRPLLLVGILIVASGR
jgi:hypothetical protein